MSSRLPIYDPDRLNAFSDGIFAFAATLLVLQFTVPDAAAVKKEGLPAALASANFVSDVVTFVLSFIIVTIYRAAHQRVFSRIEHTDSVVSRLNTFFLLCIAFLPFATALFSNYAVELSFEIYAGTLAAAGALLIAISFYANTRPALMPLVNRTSRKSLIREAAAPAIFLLSIPLSLLVGAQNAPYSWILIAPADPVLKWLLGEDRSPAKTNSPQAGREHAKRGTHEAADDEEAHPT